MGLILLNQPNIAGSVCKTRLDIIYPTQLSQIKQSTYPVWVGHCTRLPNFIELGDSVAKTNTVIIGSEIAIDDPTLGGFWVEICHQFSAPLLQYCLQ